MRLIKDLGFVVVRLVVAVFQGPLGRDAVLVLDLFEISLSQSEEGGAVDLRIAPNPVGGLRMERLPFAILPNFIGMIAILDKDRFGIPVFFLLRQKGAAFQDENAFPTRSKALRESAATGPGADNDNVEMVRVHRAFLCGVTKSFGGGASPRKKSR